MGTPRISLTDTPVSGNKNVIYAQFAQQHYPRVLELGPYDGTDTVNLAWFCDELVSLEARQENIDATQARVDAAGLTNVKIIQANLELYDLAQLGKFDAVWASGIIYHLPTPWELIEQIGHVTDLCYGWTHLAETWGQEKSGFAGREYGEIDHPLAGLSPRSWWLTPIAFVGTWLNYGFKCEFLTPPDPHPNGGLSAQFVARRNG